MTITVTVYRHALLIVQAKTLWTPVDIILL